MTSLTEAPKRRAFRPDAVLAVAVFYGLVLASLGMLRHHNFWSGAFDMGVYGQGEWLISHGHADSSLIGRNLFSDHVSAAYALLAVFYRIWSSVDLLIIVQAVALACCVHPHVRLARSNGFSSLVAMAVVVFSSALFSAGMFDFHTSVLATPFLLWALVAIQEGRSRLLIVMAICVVMCRADLVTCVLAFIVLAPRNLRVRLIAVVVFGGSLLALPMIFGGGSPWDIHYSALGDSPTDAIRHPWRAMAVVFSLASAKSVLFWVAPFALIPFLSPRRIFAVLLVGSPLLLSGNNNLHQPWFHYGATVEPFVFFALLDPANRRWMPLPRMQFIVVVFSILNFVFISPVTTVAPPYQRLSNAVLGTHGVNGGDLLKVVPSSAGVAAVDPFVSHLTHRRDLYQWPAPFVNTGPQGPASTASRQVSISYVVITSKDEARARSFGFGEVVLRSGDYIVLKR